MNQRPMGVARCRRVGHSRLPVTQIRSEVIHRERGGLLVAPMFRNGPEHVGISGDLFGESSPLDVTHYAAFAALFQAGEFSSCDQWWRWRSGIAALRRHEVGEIQSSGRDANQCLSRL